MRTLPIWECQPGVFRRPTEELDGYQYVKPRDGLHEFVTRDGKRELFAKHKSVAGWHLKRGQWCYEFCRRIGA
jgi:hypothetical protein